MVAVLLLHRSLSPGGLTWPAGLTVISKDSVGPSHMVPPLSKWGVTVMVPVRGSVPPLVVVKEISPVPLAGSPIPGVVLVQVYVVVPPVLFVEKAAPAVTPSHNT